MNRAVNILVVLFFMQGVIFGQVPMVQDSLLTLNIEEGSQTKQLKTEDILLLNLYYRYKEYVVYKNAPFKGLSFDIDKPFLQNRFFDQLTFGLGAFTWDFKETGNKRVGGALFGHPLFMGWEFTLYNQFRLTAGTTLMEERYSSDNSRRMVPVNSFLGVSGKFPLNFKAKNPTP